MVSRFPLKLSGHGTGLVFPSLAEFIANLLKILALISSAYHPVVVRYKSFRVPVIEVVVARLSNESALPRTTDLTPKNFGRLDAGPKWMIDSNLPDEGYSSGRFHHVQAGVIGTCVVT